MIKENYIFFDIDAKNKEEALDFVSSKAFELAQCKIKRSSIWMF